MYKIVKVAKNNYELYELEETKTDYKGDSFKIWKNIKSFGKDVITEEIKTTDEKIDDLNPIKIDKIAKLQEYKNILLEIKTLSDNEI